MAGCENIGLRRSPWKTEAQTGEMSFFLLLRYRHGWRIFPITAGSSTASIPALDTPASVGLQAPDSAQVFLACSAGLLRNCFQWRSRSAASA
jgi:hypothetical protein